MFILQCNTDIVILIDFRSARYHAYNTPHRERNLFKENSGAIQKRDHCVTGKFREAIEEPASLL